MLGSDSKTHLESRLWLAMQVMLKRVGSVTMCGALAERAAEACLSPGAWVMLSTWGQWVDRVVGSAWYHFIEPARAWVMLNTWGHHTLNPLKMSILQNLGSRRVLVGTRHQRCWEQNITQMQMLRDFDSACVICWVRTLAPMKWCRGMLADGVKCSTCAHANHTL